MATRISHPPTVRHGHWAGTATTPSAGMAAGSMKTPPRAVWPLLGTIAGYQSVALGTVLWFAVPVSITVDAFVLVTGAAVLATLAAMLWLLRGAWSTPRAQRLPA